MKWSGFLELLRNTLNDDNDPFDWSPEMLARWTNEGVNFLWSKVTECRFTSAGVRIEYASRPIITGDTPEQDMVLDEPFMTFLADFVLSRAFEREGGDTADMSRAAHHWNRCLVFLRQYGFGAG